jgi:hypothetical protein
MTDAAVERSADATSTASAYARAANHEQIAEAAAAGTGADQTGRADRRQQPAGAQQPPTWRMSAAEVGAQRVAHADGNCIASQPAATRPSEPPRRAPRSATAMNAIDSGRCGG